MKTQIKRFRVFDIEEQKLIGKFDTLEECVIKLLPEWEGGNPYLDFMVDDVHEDVEVNWVDLMEAWSKGERPQDLSMF